MKPAGQSKPKGTMHHMLAVSKVADIQGLLCVCTASAQSEAAQELA